MRYTDKVTVLYDGYCLFCKRTKTIITYLDWFHRIRFINIYDTTAILESNIIIPSAEDLLREIHLIDTNARTYKGFYAVRKICTLLPLTIVFSPLLYIPGSERIGSWLYAKCAATRHSL